MLRDRMEARAAGPDPTATAWRRVAERFARWRAPGSEAFYEALAKHFAHLSGHPVLPLRLERQAFLLDYGPAFRIALARRA